MSLQEALTNKKITFFVGKGGVGKTTLAAATGVSLAEKVDGDQRVLVASTDPSHSLTDVLQLPYSSGDTVKVYGDLPLDIVQIDPKTPREYAGPHHLLKFLKFLADRGIPLDLDSASCMISLAEYAVNLDRAGYSKLIVDSEPTAGLFRLLDLPETIEKNMRRLSRHALLPYAFEILSEMSRSLKKFTADDFKKDAKSLADLLTKFRTLLYDPNQAGFVVVTSPERAVVAETNRLIGELGRYGFSIDGVIFNRFLSQEYDSARIRTAQNLLATAFQREHSGIPVNRVQYQGTDNLDRRLLYEIGKGLLSNSTQLPAP